MQYRRSHAPGATFFFTVNLVDRSSRLLLDHVHDLRESFRVVQQRHPFYIDGIVIMPNHLHAIWTLPEEDSDYSTRWSLIKAGFSRALPSNIERPATRRHSGERGVWQKRFWEHRIRDDNDYARHVDYIHYNPVKHGYVDRPVDWPYSSLHRYIARGMVEEDWAAAPDHNSSYGE